MDDDKKNSIENHESCGKCEAILKQLDEQKALVKDFQGKFEALFTDFNYNVQLIYDRDQEIDGLHGRIDELTLKIREKDLEIINLQKICKKVKQLEADKLVMAKRLEALISANCSFPKAGQKKACSRQDVRNSPFSKGISHHKGSATDRQKNEEEPVPLTRINSDLEKRIKALEDESYAKKGSLLTAQVSNRDKITLKEKEISELIKSLSPYKKDPKHKSFASVDLSNNYFIKDVQRIKVYADRPGSRLVVETDESSVRCISSLGQGD
jgi:hypothetical protein